MEEAEGRTSTGTTLSSSERHWLEMRSFLESRGYRVNIRSPTTPARSGSGVTDELWTTDAIRVSDETPVWLFPQTSSPHLPMIEFFSTLPLRADRRNRLLPMFEVIPLSDNERHELLVIPPLRTCKHHHFKRLGNAIDFLWQLFEGLKFMHENNIAHRNIDTGNIFMDATSHYLGHLPPFRRLQYRFLHRRSLSRVYFFPSGSWIHFPNLDMPRRVLGTIGPNQNAPELSDTVLYDPFKVDVWALADVIKKLLLDECDGVEFLEPLVANMQKENPAERLSASEAFEEFRRITRKIGPLNKRKRMVYRDDFPDVTLCGLYLDFVAILRPSLERLGRMV